MTHARPVGTKIPTKIPQPARRPDTSARVHGAILGSATRRVAARSSGEVIELEHGITVYPASGARGRWRAVWQEDGERQQCEAASQERLALKLEKVTERLAADASNMKRPGADLVAHYLDPDRLPVERRSRPAGGTAIPPAPRRRRR